MAAISFQRPLIGWVGWFLFTFLVAALGSFASVEAKDFYAALTQPAWAPPPWLFGPVWTTLYVMMALSVGLVWQAGGWRVRGRELSVFVLQLCLNGLWSWLFFVWHMGAFAFVEVMLLWLSIFVTLVLFWRVRPLAGLLLLPYLAWVTFAAILNGVLWQLNPSLL